MQEPTRPAPSPLDSKVISARGSIERRRRNRAFHRVVSGLQRGGRQYRFLTLTTAAGTDTSLATFQRDFRRLKARLQRRGWMRSYIKVIELTRGGLPHAHIILAGGSYIPVALIAEFWLRIHGAPIVDIREALVPRGGAQSKPQRRMAGELAKYVGKDPTSRLAYSWSWLWPRLAGTWGEWRHAARYSEWTWANTLLWWQHACWLGIPPPDHPALAQTVEHYRYWVVERHVDAGLVGG